MLWYSVSETTPPPAPAPPNLLQPRRIAVEHRSDRHSVHVCSSVYLGVCRWPQISFDINNIQSASHRIDWLDLSLSFSLSFSFLLSLSPSNFVCDYIQFQSFPDITHNPTLNADTLQSKLICLILTCCVFIFGCRSNARL